MTDVLDTSSRLAPKDTPKKDRGFRPDVEGLRAIAVVLVVLYHAGIPGIRGGYIGVDVFFVISGYLITGILLREGVSTGKISILGFYTHRARRILPAAMLTILGTVLAAHYLENFLQSNDVAVDARWAVGFLANVRFSSLGTNYLTSSLPPSPLQHFWSLAVEEQFYVVWPLVLLVICRVARAHSLPVARIATTILTLTSLWWCIVETHSSATTAYFSPFTRGWELGFGCLVAAFAAPLARVPQRLATLGAWAGIAAILVSAVTYDSSTPFPGTAALLPVVGTAVVIAAGIGSYARRSPGRETSFSAEWFLARKPVQFAGRRSYSLYLVHYPILIITAAYVGHALSMTTRLLLVAVSFAVAIAMSVLVENPVRRSSGLRNSPARTIWLAVAMLLVPLTVAHGFTASQDRSDRADAVVAQSVLSTPASSAAGGAAGTVETAVASAVTTKSVTHFLMPLSQVPQDQGIGFTDGCMALQAGVKMRDCTYGDLRSTRTIVLFGDSHATQWLPPLAEAATRLHYRVVLMTKAACPISAVRTWDYVAKHEYSNCEAFHADAMATIDKMHPALVVAASQYGSVDQSAYSVQQGGPEQAWLKGIGVTLDRLKSMAGSVAYLADTPYHASLPINCVLAHLNSLSSCNTPVDQAVSLQRDTGLTHIATDSGALYVQTRRWFCTTSTCPDVIHNTVVTHDSGHMTRTYAMYLTGVLSTSLKMTKR